MDNISLVNTRIHNKIKLNKKMGDCSNKTKEFIRHSRAKNTIRVYSSDWRLFIEWCEQYQFRSLPATEEMIAIYIAAMVEDGMKTSTILLLVKQLSDPFGGAFDVKLEPCKKGRPQLPSRAFAYGS